MVQKTHYEILAQEREGAGWTLCDAKSDRNGAVKLAETIIAEDGVVGIKIVKQVYDEDNGDYHSRTIFEDGRNKTNIAPAQEDVPNTIPCFRSDDLYSVHARKTIYRLLGGFLVQNKITVIELLHRADMLDKLENTGTLLQHAIQKVAVAQASSGKTPVQNIIKSLNNLTAEAYARVFRDAHDNVFPDIQAEKFGALATKLAGRTDGAYVLNGTIARHLRDTGSWNEKIVRLIRLMEMAPPNGAGGRLLLSATSGIVAEILHSAAALQDLIGPRENLGEALIALVNLFLGREPAEKNRERQGIILLTRGFAADELPKARLTVAARLIAEIKCNKRLCPDSIDGELHMLRKIAELAAQGVGKYLSRENLTAAIDLRSQRFVAYENLNEHLSEFVLPGEKLDRLFYVEKFILGVRNKQRLAAFSKHLIGTTEFQGYFRSQRISAMKRLRRLASLNQSALGCGFKKKQRLEIADSLDAIANDIACNAKLFVTLEAMPASHAEKVLTLLKLFSSGTFTEGRLSAKARALTIAHLSQPGFLAGYVALKSKSGESNTAAAAAELMAILQKIGISPETGRKAIAA